MFSIINSCKISISCNKFASVTFISCYEKDFTPIYSIKLLV